MGFKISTNGKLLDPSFARNLDKQIETSIYEATGSFIGWLKERTAQGRGYDGSTFGKYSKQWAEARRLNGNQTSTVDLSFDGNMLKSMSYKVQKLNSGWKSIVYFLSTLSNTKALGIEFRQGRKFFGISPDEEVKFNQRVKDLIDLKEANK